MSSRKRYEFWKDWKHKTKQELQYIAALKRARLFILKNLPKKKIHSIYVKGSFVMRELTPRSDIDIVIITNDSRMLKRIIAFKQKYNPQLKPAEIVTPYSLAQFKKIEPHPKNEKGSMAAVFLFHLDYHKLIYGTPIDKSKYYVPSAQNRLKRLIRYVEKEYLPAYYNGKSFGFRCLTKIVFWLTDLELQIKTKESCYSYKGMTRKVKDKHHIVHDAMRIRKMDNTKDPRLRREFLKKLKRYLRELKKLL
jgi:predicted nucleotidyltransferase